MKVRLLVSHPANNRPTIKMARVDGCTFFRREDGWRHVERSCKRMEHWIWSIKLLIGECALVLRGGKLSHEGKMCRSASSYLEAQEKLTVAQNELEATKLDPEGDVTDKKRQELTGLIANLKMTHKPRCLYGHEIPTKVGGCEFVLEGDVFKHQRLRCKQREHYQDFGDDRKMRLTRNPGWKAEEFAKAANEALAKIAIPTDLRAHITLEV